MIVDIRHKSQWDINGVPESVCIPERYISENLELLKSNQKIIFVCDSGINARRIAHKYKDLFWCEGKRLRDV